MLSTIFFFMFLLTPPCSSHLLTLPVTLYRKFELMSDLWLVLGSSKHMFIGWQYGHDGKGIYIIYIHCFVCVFQTGCSPASAFASYSKHPASPPRADGMNRSASGVSDSSSDTIASNILSAPQSVSLASDSPPKSPLEGDVVIPCEFCGVALEEAVVFHHQVCLFSKFGGQLCRKRS